MRVSAFVLALLTLGSCAGLPVPGRPSIVLAAPYVSSRLTPSTAEAVQAELGRVVATRYNLQTKGEASGLTEVLPGDTEQSLRVTFRVVSAGAVVSSFSSTVFLNQRPQWAWIFLRQWEKSLAAGVSPKPWREGNEDEALDQALRDGDTAEALRLAGLIADKTGQASLASVVGAEVQRVRTAEQARRYGEFLSRPKGSPRSESLELLRFLDLVRENAAETDAHLGPAVAQAFKTRFGRDLPSQLERPALALVEGGTYSMGSEDEADERPLHPVTVSTFLMGRYEVTQAQYEAVLGTNPSLFTQSNDAPRRPVERVTWFDAVEFCNRLSVQEGLEPVYTVKGTDVAADSTKNGYRLPTEAEWEWAARGGVKSTGSVLAGGGEPGLVAWTDAAAGGPGPVGEKAPNELGLYDMSGNVWEWCSDWYGKYAFGPVTDPAGPTGILKVGRGGSWHAAAWNARVTARSFDSPASRSNNLGFRVARTLTPP